MLVKKIPEIYEGGTWRIRVGKLRQSFVDYDDWLKQNRFHWRPKRKKKNIYAVRRFVRNGKTYEISMHRAIMHSSPGEEPHHKNHDTLDNRKINLENVPHSNHPRY